LQESSLEADEAWLGLVGMTARDFLFDLIEQNIYVNHVAGRLLPRTSFRCANSLPGDCLPWSDARHGVTISFDCDTDRDLAAFPPLLEILGQNRVPASFAVIGSLLRENVEPYRALLAAGHEVFCHGDARHTSTDGGKYHSDLFYEELTAEQIEHEIIRSKAAIVEHLGVEPLGFRTPHFGSFQRQEQITLLYTILRKHGFRYSSSLLVWHARRQGRLFGDDTLIEFPLSATVGPPISIIDSWNMIIRDRQRGRPPRLERAFLRACREMLAAPAPMYMNVYFDPSHVFDYPPFRRMIAAIADLRRRGDVWIGTYKEAVENFR
jgi:peptidoglycan/xylan/chitin deacetylase (PgdA/CDA1 family)